MLGGQSIYAGHICRLTPSGSSHYFLYRHGRMSRLVIYLVARRCEEFVAKARQEEHYQVRELSKQMQKHIVSIIQSKLSFAGIESTSVLSGSNLPAV